MYDLDLDLGNFLEEFEEQEQQRQLEEAERMERKKYFWLPLDNYGQPSGEVKELQMNYYELQVMKNRSEYIFESYLEAMYRVND